jgi:hypothetical protein
MGRMSEYSQDQEERENLSGIDDCEAWHEHNRRILDQLGELNKIFIKESRNDQARNLESSKTPF